jgi:AcrR family transcriptional regulator
MANVKNNSASKETQRRLMEAAGEVFAECGFHMATMKAITDRAGASLASINYHFGDKAELYAAVIRGIESHMSELVTGLNNDFAGTPIVRLRQMIVYIVQQMLSFQPTHWEQVIMARELAQPSPAMMGLIERVIKPVNNKLSMLIAEAIGLDQSAQSVGLFAASVIGQIVYYLKDPVFVFHPQISETLSTTEIANHIADFSIAAVQSFRSSTLIHRTN